MKQPVTAESSFYLSRNKSQLRSYLIKRQWLRSGQQIAALEIPGQGNMNLVLRVIPDKSESFIIKQARPWVEKYPELPAPVERINVEYQYYSYINQHAGLAEYSPVLLGYDDSNFVLCMEDLGNAKDYSFIYKKGEQFDDEGIWQVIQYLNRLKQIPRPREFPSNIALRKLNHQHIFDLPFRDNSFDLDQIQPGLKRLSDCFKRDQLPIHAIKKLGDIYLGPGSFLLHGDLYPGSMLTTPSGIKIIDPEFSFLGPEEWDIAVFTAHLLLSQTPTKLIKESLQQCHTSAHFDSSIFAGFTGVEVIRRVLGLAQLPLELSIKDKGDLIEQAAGWIKTGKINTLSGYV